MEKRQIGNNVEATIEGDVLTIRVDLSKVLGPSKSGKTRLIASTNGNAQLPSGERVGLNIYRQVPSASEGARSTRLEE